MPSQRPLTAVTRNSPKNPASRRRDAAATRLAILEAARTAFGRAGYDQVGLREIAAAAGVDVALIGRYFGSKEALFAAALTPTEPPPLPPADRSQFGEWLVRRVLERQPQDPTRLLIFHHSATNPRAAAIVRELLHARFIGPFGRWVGGEDGELRAALVLSQLAGLALMRRILAIEPLASAERERVIRLVGPILQAYVDGPDGASSEAGGERG